MGWGGGAGGGASGLRAGGARAASSERLCAAGRGKGAWRVGEAPLIIRRGAFERHLGASGVVCRDGHGPLVVAGTGHVMAVPHGHPRIGGTAFGRHPPF